MTTRITAKQKISEHLIGETWFPSGIYAIFCSGLSVDFTSGQNFGNIFDYQQLNPLSWNFDKTYTYLDTNLPPNIFYAVPYNDILTIGPYNSMKFISSVIITDAPHNTGTYIFGNYLYTGRYLNPGQTLSISGIFGCHQINNMATTGAIDDVLRHMCGLQQLGTQMNSAFIQYSGGLYNTIGSVADLTGKMDSFNVGGLYNREVVDHNASPGPTSGIPDAYGIYLNNKLYDISESFYLVGPDTMHLFNCIEHNYSVPSGIRFNISVGI